MSSTKSTPYYNKKARELVERYESLSFDEVHRDLLPFVPAAPSVVLDVGAGSGRDAAFLASRNLFVVAVEPSDTLRQLASEMHTDKRIFWIDDSLPNLRRIRETGIRFNFVLLSAVWMHLPEDERPEALHALAEIIAPRGVLAISLRIGAPDTDRHIHSVTAEEVLELASDKQLSELLVSDMDDRLGRQDVRWTTVILQKSAPVASDSSP